MTLSWLQIFRLGLVQAALGAIVVLMTSTLNRLMVVELALPVVLPGALVALHYGVQITRPQWGHLADQGGNRTRWIIAGMALLALGGVGATLAIPLLESNLALGLAVSVVAYIVIGLGVGASGTSLLALLATATADRRRPRRQHESHDWMMKRGHRADGDQTAGSFQDPYSHARTCSMCFGHLQNGPRSPVTIPSAGHRNAAHRRAPAPRTKLRERMRRKLGDRAARNLPFQFPLSMTAYHAGTYPRALLRAWVFNFTPGQSTSMSGAQNGGVFLGMVLVAWRPRAFGLAACGHGGGCGGLLAALPWRWSRVAGASTWALPLVPLVVTLGFFNGMFAVAAIGSMMQLAGEGADKREGAPCGPVGRVPSHRGGFWRADRCCAGGCRPRVDARGRCFCCPCFYSKPSYSFASASLAARIMTARENAALVPGE